MAEKRPPREQQTQSMAVGAAFDAYVKSYLYKKILPNGPLLEQFDFIKIFNEQVEPQNREWAVDAGWEVMELYKKSGALADLTLELTRGQSEPRFEFVVRGVIDDVPILGKPDVWFVNVENQPIILDWKVNGYCGVGRSPAKGYVRLRSATGNLGKSHKDALIYKEHGVLVNSAHPLETVDESWATQISTYAWLCGAAVGSPFICAIDQIYRDRGGALGVAEHRTRVGQDYQLKVLEQYKELWNIIKSRHIFREYSEEDSKKRQMMLDEVYTVYNGTGGDLITFIKTMKDQQWK